MIWLSLLVFLLMCIVHVPTNHSPLRPISLELAGGNGLAWLLMFGLCGVVLVFAHRLKKCGHAVRTYLLLLDAVGILVIAFTPPDSNLHEGVLEIVAIFTLVWFTIMAADYDCSGLLYLSAVSVVILLMLALFSLGLAEKGLITYCLVSSNVLYYNCLHDANDAIRRKWN